MDPSLLPPRPPQNRREELNEIFVGFLGSRQVYFQPDDAIVLKYPAIIYELDEEAFEYADNEIHRETDRYQVTVIDRDPDVPASKKIKRMRYCSFDRMFREDGLNHKIYSLYF